MALIERNTVEVMGRDDLLGLLDTPHPHPSLHRLRDLRQGSPRHRPGVDGQGPRLPARGHRLPHPPRRLAHLDQRQARRRPRARSAASPRATSRRRCARRCSPSAPTLTRVHFVLGTDLYDTNPDYWTTVHRGESRTRRWRGCCAASASSAASRASSVDFAKLIYPAMQAADIFAQGVNLAHAGTEQRKAHVIARDVATRSAHQPAPRHRRDGTIKPAGGAPPSSARAAQAAGVAAAGGRRPLRRSR